MSRPIIARAEAIALGLKTFYPGTLCVHGHRVERYTNASQRNAGQCVACKNGRPPVVTMNPRHYIGELCPNGHVERLKSTGRCAICKCADARRRRAARLSP